MGKLVLTNETLTTPFAGTMEYDGAVPYFTPSGLQRGVVPGMQFYSLNSGFAGANATGAQNILNVGVTLSSSTIYTFELNFVLAKTAGTTSHTVASGFGGTATLNNINYLATAQYTTNLTTGTPTVAWISTASATVFTSAITTATFYVWAVIKGIVSVNAGGTFIPQYTLSAAPGGAYTTQIGSYMSIYPIGAAGANVNVGTWA